MPEPTDEDARLFSALRRGDPEEVQALIAEGIDLSRRGRTCDPLLEALHGRDISRDPRLLDLLRLLVGHGIQVNGVSKYQESALRVLSNVGRFDAIQLLLDAGADESQLQWTPLMRAVVAGTVADVERELDVGAPLDDCDWWQRTPWLMALAAGDLQKAQLLLDRGANGDARGRCGKPALFYAIDSHNPDIVRWLLEIGADVDQCDDFGMTALIHAAESGDRECLGVLLAAGADVDRDVNGTALNHATDRGVILRLLAAGANPAGLSHEGRRAILRLPPDPDIRLLTASADEFHRASVRRFGASNPERTDEPFWIAMIRSGVDAWSAGQHFGETRACQREPIWCARRFGQSLTFLPDGRIVQIAGEHEDHYDPDFCIYNDVFVHGTDGSISIWSYPEESFPPTDFHTATLVDDVIYVIGSLGYRGTRRYGTTPVFRLEVGSWRIERLSVSGDGPGWIHGHRATPLGPGGIRVTEGYVLVQRDGKEAMEKNDAAFVLDLESRRWRRENTG